jgi:hypothetical protein
MIPFPQTRLKAVHVGCLLLASLPLLSANAASHGERPDDAITPTDYVDMVDPYLMSARPGVYWYFMDGNQDREA